MIKLYIIFFLSIFGWNNLLYAKDFSYNHKNSPNNIRTIKIIGNNRIEDFTIKTFLLLKENDVYSEDKLNKSLKNIYATGLFTSVDLKFNQGELTVNIQENPLVNKVIFEGNKYKKDEELLKELNLKSRSVFSKNKFRDDVIRIRNIYAKEGRLNMTVSPKIVKLNDNRLNLIYEIKEGKKTFVREIIFVGANIFKRSELKSVIASKQKSLLHIFSSAAQFDEAKLEYDKELLRKFYNSQGYADFKASVAIADFSRHSNSVILTYMIEEGNKYEVDNVKIDNHSETKLNDKIKSDLVVKPEQTYNGDKIQKDMNSIIKILNAEGYPFSDVESFLERNLKEKKISVTYVIKPSHKMYIDKINILGNSRTYDSVIRRELEILEAEPYNLTRIENSREKLLALDYFKSVDFSPKKSENHDKLDLDIKVKEKNTTKIRLNLAYSTQDGVAGKIGFVEKNLLGRGQEISVDFVKYSKRYDIDFSFTEPYFLGKKISASVDLGIETQKADKGKSMNYDARKDIIGTTLGYRLTDNLQHAVRYTNENSKIKRPSRSKFTPSIELSEFIIQDRDERPKTRTSAIGQSFVYDRRNSIISPTSGYMLRLDQDLAGIGGNVKYIKHQISGKKYIPVTEKITAKIYGKARYIKGLGERVMIENRFHNNDYDIRGFEERGIGPRDKKTKDSLGGNEFYTAGAELVFPMGLPKELEMTGHVFAEAGILKNLDLSPAQRAMRKMKIDENNQVRASIGVGIECITRMGPFKFSLAHPLAKAKFDRTQLFVLSFETD